MPEAQELARLITETDMRAFEYAGQSLARATVAVSVEDCDYPFNAVPTELQEPFSRIGHPTTRVSNLNMQLSYDKAEQFFAPNEVQIVLDNGLSMLFSRMRNLTGLDATPLDKQWGVFYPQILTRAGKSLVKPEKTTPVPANVLGEILESIGVELPTAPKRADWTAIQSMFYFSNRWHATARHDVPIDLTSSLYVEERRDGRGPVHVEDEDSLPAFTPEEMLASTVPHMVELTLGLDESQQPADIPRRTVKYIMRADDDLSLPEFRALYSIPLHYEPAFLGELDTVRNELVEQSQLLTPNQGIIRKFLGAMDMAEQIDDPFGDS
ncbi:MAG TPA: hypothetical protein VN031_03665 [Candidatus Microsaccharimonas sp.]|nr:hypothetical protein [Candidatus Microsaccharimonas sp.]